MGSEKWAVSTSSMLSRSECSRAGRTVSMGRRNAMSARDRPTVVQWVSGLSASTLQTTGARETGLSVGTAKIQHEELVGCC